MEQSGCVSTTLAIDNKRRGNTRDFCISSKTLSISFSIDAQTVGRQHFEVTIKAKTGPGGEPGVPRRTILKINPRKYSKGPSLM